MTFRVHAAPYAGPVLSLACAAVGLRFRGDGGPGRQLRLVNGQWQRRVRYTAMPKSTP
ncbi:hypothetical protein [Burkholderia sp. Ac-20379]|uniref:hypothetical protein n=1 Tax=Burkholderia sp. Ac-20379 TaxID=2703900 RepID=UPI0019821C9B|nr:hypothetical protein [Burkholderia sp. Ac-20379]MBN3725575.1 hypothetical protein [Burkholderia sp. Ac-20379]